MTTGNEVFDPRKNGPVRRNGAVGRSEVELALTTIKTFLDTDQHQTLKDVAEDLRRSGRRLFWLAKIIEESLDASK